MEEKTIKYEIRRKGDIGYTLTSSIEGSIPSFLGRALSMRDAEDVLIRQFKKDGKPNILEVSIRCYNPEEEPGEDSK